MFFIPSFEGHTEIYVYTYKNIIYIVRAWTRPNVFVFAQAFMTFQLKNFFLPPESSINVILLF